MMTKINTNINVKLLLIILIAIIGSQFSLMQASTTQGESDLFMDTQYRGDTARSKDATIVRTRFTKVNFSLLPGGQEGTQNQRSAFLDLNLFGGVYFQAISDGVHKDAQGHQVWIGRIDGQAHSQVTIVYKDGIMAANVALPGRFYKVRYAGDGVHAIHELDHSKFEPCGVEDAHQPKASISQSIDNVSTSMDSADSIDVMVVYSAAARTGSGSVAAIEAEIALAVTETNTGYANSGINQRINLVHSEEVSYTESGSISTDLNRLEINFDGYMDNVHTLRDTYGADCVILITENGGGACGIANLITIISVTQENRAFGVVRRICATGNYSFGHELGHIMAARHDRYVDNVDNSPYTYNHGYVNLAEDWRTIMAYNKDCVDNGDGGCVRLNYWSNPNVNFGGVPMGIAEGNPNAADNRKTLDNTAFTVANFRQHVTPDGDSITVTSPDGGESWTEGTSQNITWTTTGTVGNVMIEYSTDNGTSYTTITSSTSNDGSHSWTVPNTISSQGLIKITDAADAGITDTSDAVFSIVAPTITVTSPNGGETLEAATTSTINWTNTGSISNVDIEYSTNGGGSWTNIVSSTTNDGAYSWTVPNAVSSNCLIRITDAADAAILDSSNAAFSIVAAGTKTITVTSPNGGESLVVGTSSAINWTNTGIINNVNIEYSINGGGSWTTIVSSTTNNGAYNWTVPNAVSSNCLIRVTDAADAAVFDTSNTVFSIVSGPTPTITVTYPKAGEIIDAGSTYTIKWNSTGAVGNVKIQLSTNNGSTYSTVTSSTTNDGNHSWSVPSIISSKCLIKISEASDNNPSDTSATFSISTASPPKISLSRSHIDFGANKSNKVTSIQSVLIENDGRGTLNWSASANASWLRVSPSVGINSSVLSILVKTSGLSAGTYNGAVTVSDSGATNSPQTISVTLKVYNTGSTSQPFGEFASPTHGANVSSSIAVTGWVIDDVEVLKVEIFNGNSYVGDAVFVEGARPDVEAAYPGYPKNYQAGWGYMMLTNFLPNGGNGTYTLSAKATDAEGNTVTLGSKTINCDNASAVKPFGALDSPSPGGTASGGNFVNWGWALTPLPNSINTNGSTIKVWIDGINKGNPTYNIYRSDIASLFPSYANSNGAVGYFYLDTTTLDNGIHTIQWTATDNANNTDGIGSRYFNVQNAGSDASNASQTIKIPLAKLKDKALNIPIDYIASASVRTGFDTNTPHKSIYPDNNGELNLKVKELERVEIRLAPDTYILSRLPIGATLNSKTGEFVWQLGVGFYGDHSLQFVREGLHGQFYKTKVNIKIDAKH
jgi:Metallo-peptidase family M12B Reprolysin-like/Viral BACON domain/Kre9/KNH-like N-terminal Ig-like domain/Bacterial Ig domain